MATQKKSEATNVASDFSLFPINFRIKRLQHLIRFNIQNVAKTSQLIIGDDAAVTFDLANHLLIHINTQHLHFGG